jgi:DNA helicase HerA-like ATPase
MLRVDTASYFARTNARRPFRAIAFNLSDRLSHVYVIGKTGVGKTTLLERLLSEDIRRGYGSALVDPHGDFVERVAARMRPEHGDKVIYLNVADEAQPFAYNPLSRVKPEMRTLVASGVMDVFKKMWADAWGVRMEHILRNALLALLDQPSANLGDLLPLLNDKRFRSTVLSQVTNEQVCQFWEMEYPNYSFRYRADATAPILNKVGAFLADPKLNRIFTRTDGQLRLRSIMDQGKILLVNLAKGKIGEDSAALLGGLLVTSLGLAAYSRADMLEKERRPFFIYVDEFQNFTTLAIANMLSELRKFGVGMVLAHQYLHQVEPDIRHAILGNAGTIISFRVGPEDAHFIAREFEPYLNHLDLMNLPNHEVYIKLMVDGAPLRPFSATKLLPRSGPSQEATRQ